MARVLRNDKVFSRTTIDSAAEPRGDQEMIGLAHLMTSGRISAYDMFRFLSLLLATWRLPAVSAIPVEQPRIPHDVTPVAPGKNCDRSPIDLGDLIPVSLASPSVDFIPSHASLITPTSTPSAQ